MVGVSIIVSVGDVVGAEVGDTDIVGAELGDTVGVGVSIIGSVGDIVGAEVGDTVGPNKIGDPQSSG